MVGVSKTLSCCQKNLALSTARDLKRRSLVAPRTRSLLPVQLLLFYLPPPQLRLLIDRISAAKLTSKPDAYRQFPPRRTPSVIGMKLVLDPSLNTL